MERSIKDWVRFEWQRSGLPMCQANRACGVANAATRKYLTQCDHWYFPPPEAIVGMAEWCTKHGRKTEWPYFSLDGVAPPDREQWRRMRAKWNHTHGLSNVWQEAPVHGPERIKDGSAFVHANQKPISLLERQILASTDPGDVIWEPFGGLFSASVAALRSNRTPFAAEKIKDFYRIGRERVEGELKNFKAKERRVA
jgi:hypothetical protein